MNTNIGTNTNNNTNIYNDTYNYNNRLNRIIYIFDNYFRNDGLEIDLSNLNDNIKIIITEDDFNKFERINYDSINKDNNDCLICIESFNENDEIVKIKCNHYFHCNCIKSWLCNESNKCPICRIEVGNGKALI
jgi:transglutaminase/protease-like cytokinesis protein 3